MSRTIYINEEQIAELKKAIAAQDQVGGKVNAGIMGAVTGMVCEDDGDGIEIWYRGYNAKYGSAHTHVRWLTTDKSYARAYGNRVDEIKINPSKLHPASIEEVEDVGNEIEEWFDYLDGPSETLAKEMLRRGYNCYYFEANNDSSWCMCTWDYDGIKVGKEHELSREEFESIDCYDGYDNPDYDSNLDENIDLQKYHIGFEKGGMEPNAHIVTEYWVYQHGATPHMEMPDFKPNLQPLTMYKQFKLRLDKNGKNLAPGYVFPLYVNTEDEGRTGKASQGLKIGSWYKSGEGECWLDTRNNRLYTKGKGYGTDGNTIQKLAYRPGWHLTTTPWGNQRGDNKVVGGVEGTGNNYLNTRNSEVWAKVEICVDVDATERARAMSKTPADQCLQSLGDREYYKYRTNSNATDDQSWYIVDMIRIVDILDDDTVDAINDKYYADLLAQNPNKKINSDPYTYTKDLENDIPYWKMPRTNGKRYTRKDIEGMGYHAVEPTKLNETTDNFQGGSFKKSNAITFITFSGSDKVYSTNERGITHNRFMQQLMRSGEIPSFEIDDSRMSDLYNRYQTGRYWVDYDTISFWETPFGKDKRHYLIDTVEQLGLNKETLDVDFWDTRRNLGVQSPFVLPYKWFVNGTLDDLLEMGVYLITKNQYGCYNVFLSDFKRCILNRNGDAISLNEAKKKVVKNDEGKVVPEKCEKCGGDVVVQIHGEPVYVCKDCGKYYGTVPFSRSLNESTANKKTIDTYRWCAKSILDFFSANDIPVKPYPRVILRDKPQEGVLVKTGYYDPNKREVVIYTYGRAIKDCLRSMAHEFIHHSQNIRGLLKGYKGDTLEGDKALERLESEAYLKGNIYFRRWTEEMRPEIQKQEHKKLKLNESIEDVFELAEDCSYDASRRLLEEFLWDKERGINKKHWNLIPAEQYKNIMDMTADPIRAMRLPENVIFNWFEDIVVPNAFAVWVITELAGHADGPAFPLDDVAEILYEKYGDKYQVYDYSTATAALDELGFYDWCSLPDGSDGWSDYGIPKIFNVLSEYQPNMDANQLLILINKVLHVGHWRGDLCSAFIEGGSKTCSEVSGIIREGVENSNFSSWFRNSKVVDKDGNPLPMYHGTNGDFTSFSKDYFRHGSNAYLGVGFNFTSSHSYASGFGKNIHEVYLRAETPMTNKKKTISLQTVIKLLQEVDSGEDPDCTICTAILGDRIVSPSWRNYYEVAKTIYEYSDSDSEIYSQFGLAYSGDNDKKIVDAFEKLGFDSSIEYGFGDRISTVVVFEPNQIKAVDAPNFNPEGDEFIDESFDMEEITNPEDVDLSSFEVKNNLHPRFWKNGRLDSRVRARLLDIADDFIDTLNIPWVEPSDIIMTGSLANYNWSKEHSDIDLHVVVDFSEVDENTELVKEYFDSKKKIWNDEHTNLTIGGFPVEVYVQDISEEHASSGVYSLEDDKWIVKPSLKNFDEDIDNETIKERAAEYMNEIDDLVDEYEDKVAEMDLSELHEKAVTLFKKIKAERKNGFESGGGELNTGNLIFKTLRRNGYIAKLSKLKLDTYDSMQSLLNENN